MTELAKINELTPREREILALVGRGLTSREIANKFFMSVDTVSTHRRNILRKTGARNILTVVAVAIQQKVIMIDKAA